MSSPDFPEEFINIFHGSMVLVYEPMSNEVDYPKFDRAEYIVLPQDKSTDPKSLAVQYAGEFEGKKVCLLIPGQRFDSTGTRHGRGGGWYDRFLSSVPEEWTRIGVSDISLFSERLLPRQNWDEPMDWLLMLDGPAWKIVKTGARGL